MAKEKREKKVKKKIGKKVDAHGHGPPKGAILLRKADGTPFTRKEVIVIRRGAFKWLPVLCSNDLVHGSWWFLWGSLGSAIFAFVPLIKNDIPWLQMDDDVLPNQDFLLEWGLLVASGIAYTIGSLAFVRAFEEPSKRPIFYWFKHLCTDELLAAWFFLLGTIPFIPYFLVFFIIAPSIFYIAALGIACIIVLGCIMFVYACYPTDKKAKITDVLFYGIIRFCTGPKMWVVKHLQNDWLAGCWFFVWGSVLVAFISFCDLGYECIYGNSEKIFIGISGAVASFFFMIGSMYFVAGSYPAAQKFIYEVKDEKSGRRRASTVTQAPGERPRNFSKDGTLQLPEVDLEAGGDQVLSPLHVEGETTTKAKKEKKKRKKGKKTKKEILLSSSASAGGIALLSPVKNSSSTGSLSDTMEYSPVNRAKAAKAQALAIALSQEDPDDDFAGDDDDDDEAADAANRIAQYKSSINFK